MIVITKDVNGAKIPFMFSIRALNILCKELGIKGIREFSERFTNDPSFEDIAAVIYSGHENACFYQKVTPTYASIDDIYAFMDEIGLTESAALVREALQAFMGESNDKKKA